MPTRYDALIDAVVKAGAGGPEDPRLTAYREQVRQQAYRITDEEVAALTAAGVSDDHLFHATTDEALKAGLERWRAGLAALEELE
ncbi:MAG: hypothetical protein IPJ65_39345 [Archangiaceae bacterium]|nr:hypothetical protein [Archangiaceae bacterium]